MDLSTASGCKVWVGSGSRLLALLASAFQASGQDGCKVCKVELSRLDLSLGVARGLQFSSDGALSGCLQS